MTYDGSGKCIRLLSEATPAPSRFKLSVWKQTIDMLVMVCMQYTGATVNEGARTVVFGVRHLKPVSRSWQPLASILIASETRLMSD